MSANVCQTGSTKHLQYGASATYQHNSLNMFKTLNWFDEHVQQYLFTVEPVRRTYASSTNWHHSVNTT